MKNKLDYTLVRGKRKTISIQITPGGEVVVRCPLRMPVETVRSFVESKDAWIRGKLQTLSERPRLPVLTQEEQVKLAEQAKHLTRNTLLSY